jgi:protein-disulfide isomerase
MMRPLTALLSLVLLDGSISLASQEPAKKGRVVAEVKGLPITESQLEKAAAGELMNLALQRQRILENQLEQLIGARLVALEAEARKVTDADLLQSEVLGKVVEPSAQETNAHYEATKGQMKEPADTAVPKIRQTLISQRRQKLYKEFIDQLKAKYDVKVMLPPVRIAVDADGYPARGPAMAPVTIVLFSDFECPYCQGVANTLAQVKKEYGDKVRLVFRQFPLIQIHPNAMKAAEASLCAADQGKFWEMHDEMFKDGERLVPAELSRRAKSIGLDPAAFDTCLSSRKHQDRIKTEIEAARALGVSSTPTMFINGRPIRGAIPFADISRFIQDDLAGAGAGAKKRP